MLAPEQCVSGVFVVFQVEHEGVVLLSLCYCPACHISEARYRHSEDEFCEKREARL